MIEIRSENPRDPHAVRSVHVAAFPTAAEADLVEHLRSDGSSILSLVAVLDGGIVGHAMFSQMRVPSDALGLGPVAVLSKHRRRGIAAALIREGLVRAAAAGWKRIFVLGDPAYYARFGFSAPLAEGFLSPYAGPHLMALHLQPGDHVLTGALDYAKPFSDL